MKLLKDSEIKNENENSILGERQQSASEASGLVSATCRTLVADTSEQYSDIFLLQKHLDTMLGHKMLNAERDYVQVAINYTPDIMQAKALLGYMGEIFVGKNSINSREMNYLLFEYGLNRLKLDLLELGNVLVFKSLIRDANIFLNIDNPQNLKLTGLIIGQNGDNVRLFLTKDQLKQVKALREILGLKSEGQVAFLCMVYAFNSTFGDISSNPKKYKDLGFSQATINSFREGGYFSDYYYSKTGLVSAIRIIISKYNANQRIYSYKLYNFIKLKLDAHNTGKVIMDSNELEICTKLINRLDDLDILNKKAHEDASALVGFVETNQYGKEDTKLDENGDNGGK